MEGQSAVSDVMLYEDAVRKEWGYKCFIVPISINTHGSQIVRADIEVRNIRHRFSIFHL